MNIVFCAPGKNPQPWLDELSVNLPEARVWAWSVEQAPGTTAAQADYAVVWAPPPALFQEQRRLQAVFNIGAGADGVMKLESLPRDIPVVRLNDAGMAVQMAAYVCHALSRRAREFDVYGEQAATSERGPRAGIGRAASPLATI